MGESEVILDVQHLLVFVMKLSRAKNKTANPFVMFLELVEVTHAKLEKDIAYQQLHLQI